MRLDELEWSVSGDSHWANAPTTHGFVRLWRLNTHPVAYNLYFYPADGGGNYTIAYHWLDALTAQCILYDLLGVNSATI